MTQNWSKKKKCGKCLAEITKTDLSEKNESVEKNCKYHHKGIFNQILGSKVQIMDPKSILMNHWGSILSKKFYQFETGTNWLLTFFRRKLFPLFVCNQNSVFLGRRDSNFGYHDM